MCSELSVTKYGDSRAGVSWARGVGVLLAILAVLDVRAASAAGVALRWSSCFGDGGPSNRTSSCTSNVGSNIMVLSAVMPPVDIAGVSGVESRFSVYSDGSALPAWWMRSCRSFVSASPTISPSAVNCLDWANGAAVGGLASYTISTSTPNRADFLTGFAVPSNNLQVLPGNQELFICNVVISNSSSTACTGCQVPVCIGINSVRFAASGSELTLSQSAYANSNFVAWQGGSLSCPASVRGPAVDAISPDSGITLSRPKVRVPVRIRRSDTTAVLGVSVGLRLTGLDLLPTDVEMGPFMSASGGNASMNVATNGAGNWTVDLTTLATPCGSTSRGDTLFFLNVGSSLPRGTGTVEVMSVDARNCSNQSVSIGQGTTASVTIANSLDPLTNLAVSQLRTGNDGDGNTKVGVTFGPVEPGLVAEVWRKGYGNHPRYDDGTARGGVPPAPVSYPPAGWTLTSVSASGQFDEPATRDYWYYVAYLKDIGRALVSPPSNLVGGVLNYHLGDVSNGGTVDVGDNTVGPADLSLLGAHYGKTGASADSVAFLDVGPTADRSVNTLPTTDGRIGFDDFILFSLNYTPVASAPASRARPVAASEDDLEVVAPAHVRAGEEFVVPVRFRGTGRMQGVSLALAWDAAVVEPVGHSAGAAAVVQGAMVLSGGEGALDVVSLAGAGNGLVGEGELASLRFRARATGAPAIALSSVEARDARNRSFVPGMATVEQGGGGVHAGMTTFSPAKPNPFRGRTTLVWTLAQSGNVRVEIYSVDGRKVRTLVDGARAAGEHRHEWDGRDDAGRPLNAGIYWARLAAPGATLKRTVVLLRD